MNQPSKSETAKARLARLCEQWEKLDREGSGSDAIFGSCAEAVRDVLADREPQDFS